MQYGESGIDKDSDDPSRWGDIVLTTIWYGRTFSFLLLLYLNICHSFPPFLCFRGRRYNTAKRAGYACSLPLLCGPWERYMARWKGSHYDCVLSLFLCVYVSLTQPRLFLLLCFLPGRPNQTAILWSSMMLHHALDERETARQHPLICFRKCIATHIWYCLRGALPQLLK